MTVLGLGIALLGRMEVCWNDQEVALPEAEAKLLAWLALHRNRAFRDQDLADILYPDSVAADEGRSGVSKLKKSLCEHLCARTQQSRPEAQKGRQIYDAFFKELLGVACIDVVQFDNLTKRPDIASKLEAMRIAVRGPFLQDWKDPWIASERARVNKSIALLHSDLKHALPAALTDLLEQEDYEAGAHLLEQVIALDLRNDSAWSNLLAEKQARFRRALSEQRTQSEAGAKQEAIANAEPGERSGQAAETAGHLRVTAPSVSHPVGLFMSEQRAEHQVGNTVSPPMRRAKGIAAGSRRSSALMGAVAALMLVGTGVWRLTTNHTTSPNVMQREAEAGTNANPEDLYKQGRILWEGRSKPELKRAQHLFQQALKLDNKQARYYSGLADTCSMLYFYGYASPESTRSQALSLAQIAVKLSKTPHEQTEAYASRAYAELLDWQWDFAESDFKMAIGKRDGNESDPALARAHQWYSLYLMATGKDIRSQREIANAYRYSRGSKAINLSSGRRYYYGKDFEEAIRHFKEMLEDYPDDSLIQYWLGLCYEGRGDSQARERLEEAALKSKPEYISALAALGHFYAKSGETAKANTILNKLQNDREVYVSPVAVAVVYMGLYDRAAAPSEKARYKRSLQEYLNKGCSDYASDMLLLHLDPRFASVQHEAWFLALMRNVLPKR